MKYVSHAVAGLAVGFIIYFALLFALRISWPNPDEVVFQMDLDSKTYEAQREAVMRPYWPIVRIAASGLVVPLALMVASCVRARRRPVIFVQRPVVLGTLLMCGLFSAWLCWSLVWSLTPF